MPSAASLVMFGYDVQLLQSRGWILAAAKYEVTNVQSARDLERALFVMCFDLLILCHSLSESDRETALLLTAKCAPEMQIVALQTMLTPYRPVHSPDVIDAKTEPARLLATLGSLLERRTNPCNKNPEEMKVAQLQGSVRWFNNAKGYGFIGPDNGSPDVFTHFTAIQADGYKTLKEGDAVTFEIVQGEKGPQADQVKRVLPEAKSH